ncbi:MAG: replicative DNA helicase [Prevotellaceae bacterium]|jgi:replicative DNA helicase|nr:replicative DNA helicase [Prevotellaceae bacterium]
MMSRDKNQRTQDNFPAVELSGRVPPYSIPSERYVLGAIMSGYRDIDGVINMLQPEMFYRDTHTIIYRAIVELHRNKTEIDIQSLSNTLKKNGNLEEVGGDYYLSKLMGDIASGSNIEYHALVVLETYIRRRLSGISIQAAEKGFDLSIPVDDIFSDIEKNLAELTRLMTVKQDVNHIGVVANSAIDEAFGRIEKAGKGMPTGITTGFNGLDALTFGWKPAELIVLAARPSMGKTAVMLHFAKAAANAGSTAVIFSLEMSKISIADRLLLSESHEGEMNINHYKSGRMDEGEVNMLEVLLGRIYNKPIYINDTPGLTIGQIHASAKEMRRNGKCDIIFIDYLQLCKGKGVSNNRTRDIEVAEISREAKEMAKELNVPVILLSQLSREVERREKKRPQLSDLRDCLPVDEWVDTPYGVVQLKSKPGRIVSVTCQGSKATGCEYIPKKYNSTYTVRTHFGSFSATARHRVLTATGWKYVCDLDEERDILASPKIITHENRGYVSHGRLLGWLIGNGYLSGTPSLTLRNELIDDLQDEIKGFGVEIKPRETQKCSNVTEVYLSNGVESGCKPNPLMEWIRGLGLEGKTAKEKSIPKRYLGTSNEAHLELLRGLWEADGTVSKGTAKYSTVSELLARQVKWMLHTIGVRSSISLEARKNNCSDLFTVVCAVEDNPNMRRICSNPKRFGALKMPSDRYIDPAPEIFVQFAQEYGASGRIQKKYGGCGRLKSIAKKRLLTMIAENPISTIQESPYVQMQGMGWTKITSISHNEDEVHVCDLHVPETNCFLTNGMVVHNSGAIEQDADLVIFVYRPEYYKQSITDRYGSEITNYGELIVSKNRNGRCGEVAYTHSTGMTKFFDYQE